MKNLMEFIKNLTKKAKAPEKQEIFDNYSVKSEVNDVNAILTAIEMCKDQCVSLIKQLTTPYPIETGLYSLMEEAIAAGNYEQVDKDINSENFSYRTRPKETKKVILLKFGYHLYDHQATAIANKLGLICPDFEDALDFGAQYLDNHFDNRVIFLHKPFGTSAPMGRWVMSINYYNKRWLELALVPYGFGSNDSFAFIQG